MITSTTHQLLDHLTLSVIFIAWLCLLFLVVNCLAIVCRLNRLFGAEYSYSSYNRFCYEKKNTLDGI